MFRGTRVNATTRHPVGISSAVVYNTLFFWLSNYCHSFCNNNNNNNHINTKCTMAQHTVRMGT